jgi:hypothetical protein
MIRIFISFIITMKKAWNTSSRGASVFRFCLLNNFAVKPQKEKDLIKQKGIFE